MEQYVFGEASRPLTHLADSQRRSRRLFISLIYFLTSKQNPRNVVVAPTKTTGNICKSNKSNPQVLSCVIGEIRRNFTGFMFCLLQGSGDFCDTRRSAVKSSYFCGTISSAGFIFLSRTSTAPNR